ncbi:hypothetical protein Asppvi_002736 [Aspergillus pseudoviridinutans]|uniref:Wax synthase domain-containing protein n=1 Tax=Aspergillus pseudoviridinutans TaxID=1517512 RepID=A0A9P3ESP8_9EURO|nr:uncharacterized protein Asppvi_002736 [Aspergillus pseudoviridinutans]GIJ83905.1 hypothetical protein Asppvi_002736 [Aspergillus pseudoviridinutans]
MPPVESLVPPALFALSSAAFFKAIHLPYKDRLYVAPLLFGSAVLSLQTSHYLTWLTGMNVLWALFSCIWIHHAASVLYIDQLSIPRTASPWISAYKIWNDPQRHLNRIALQRREETCSTSRRIWFSLRRLSWTVICWLLQLSIVGPLLSIHFTFNAEDFAPSRQILIRRLFSLQPEPAFTAREMQIRFYVSVYWIWIAYLMLELCNTVLALFFVVVLRLDHPEDWTPLFGSPLQAYSIRRFWTKFWHRLTVAPCASSGRMISRRVAVLQPGSQHEKIFIAFWTFLLSGIFHVVADWAAGEPCYPIDDMLFFIANFLAGAIESAIGKRLEHAMKESENGRVRWLFRSGIARKIIGYVWVLGFMFWITPKWQYRKLHDSLMEFSDPQLETRSN